MKSQVKASPQRSCLATRSWARFSPTSGMPASASAGQAVGVDVLGGHEDLDFVGATAGGGGCRRDPVAHLGERAPQMVAACAVSAGHVALSSVDVVDRGIHAIAA